MGIYDRPYIREDADESWFARRTMIANLIIVNAVVFFVSWLLRDSRVNFIDQCFELDVRALAARPWELWRLVSYGFLHADLWHIFWNMYGLWLFGTPVEDQYGRREVLWQYLFFIVVSGLGWMLVRPVIGDSGTALVGASGAVMGMLVLFVANNPQRVLLFFGVLPMRAITLGALYVGLDLLSLLGNRQARDGSQVAYAAHLAGAAAAYLYFRFGWNFSRWTPRSFQLGKTLRGVFRRRPNLRVHKPDEGPEQGLEDRVDELLGKIASHGEASLSDEERRFLEDASRRYRVRRGE